MRGKEVKEAVKNSGIKLDELVAKSGIPERTLYNLYAKEKVEQHYLEKLAKAGVKLPKLADSNMKTIGGDGPKNLIIVPIKAVGGFLSGYEDEVYLDELESIHFPFIQGQGFAFEVEGFSMVSKDNKSQSFMPGSWVICTPIEGPSWLRKNKVFVFQTIDGLIIKEFVKIEDEKYHLRSYNEEYNPVAPIPVKKVKRMYFVEFNMSKPG